MKQTRHRAPLRPLVVLSIIAVFLVGATPNAICAATGNAWIVPVGAQPGDRATVVASITPTDPSCRPKGQLYPFVLIEIKDSTSIEVPLTLSGSNFIAQLTVPEGQWRSSLFIADNPNAIAVFGPTIDSNQQSTSFTEALVLSPGAAALFVAGLLLSTFAIVGTPRRK